MTDQATSRRLIVAVPLEHLVSMPGGGLSEKVTLASDKPMFGDAAFARPAGVPVSIYCTRTGWAGPRDDLRLGMVCYEGVCVGTTKTGLSQADVAPWRPSSAVLGKVGGVGPDTPSEAYYLIDRIVALADPRPLDSFVTPNGKSVLAKNLPMWGASKA